ncbi:hypothetical protein [Sphingomonas sp.]|jgi:hypothetical protein|uniref:hypothetical protein n=1 Tax=Sphingomonas sp. TaxID=28214 RepID=UPI002EDA127D
MKTRSIALLAATALALAACAGGNDDEQPAGETNVANIAVESGNMMNVTTEAPPATRVDNTASEATAPSATLTADEQTTDDADATGMTSRVNRDEAGNSGQPAQ